MENLLQKTKAKRDEEEAAQAKLKQSIEDEEKRLREIKEKFVENNYSVKAENIRMQDFIIERVLDHSPEHKSINLLGHMRYDPSDNKMIVIFSKSEFKDQDTHDLFTLDKIARNGVRFTEQYFHNSEFRKFYVNWPRNMSTVQANVIYPASEKLIAKYSAQKYSVVRETAAIYNDVVAPHYI